MNISYSLVSVFLNCKRKYYWSYIKGLKQKDRPIAFMLGDAIHEGIYNIYDKNSDYIIKAIDVFNKQKDELILVSADDEIKLNEQEYIIRGMLDGYGEKYEEFIEETSHVKNELKLEVKIGDDILIMKLDNILKNGEKFYLHEIKTTRVLDITYIKNIRNDLQSTIYYHFADRSIFNVHSILYDIIKKPSIRKKKGENYEQFLERLIDYYKTDKEVFYMEEIDKPLIDYDRCKSLLEHVVADIKNCNDIDDYYPNEMFCYVKQRCLYYDICHYGENEITLSFFKRRSDDKDGVRK